MNSSKQKLNLISLGCAKALVDSELLLGSLQSEDFTITKEPQEADTIVINTCGFLNIAREESIETILQASELKTTGNLKQLVVMGCLSERYPEELSKEIPEVDRFFGSNDHKQIISFLTGKDYAKEDPLFYRSLITPSHYAYIKIAEGCDNGCSFCSIPIMRGLQKSRSIDSIIWEAEKLVENGVKELLIIAQDSTSYGWDLKPKVYLNDLIQSLNNLNVDWIRLHYAHPAHLSQRIIEELANSEKYKKKKDALCCFRGVATTTAMTLITEIGDINRFSHPSKLTSYAGLDIREYSSGGREKKFGITKLGNSKIRTAAVESCQKSSLEYRISKRLKANRKGQPEEIIDIADRCMKRLRKKSLRLQHKGKHINKVKVACAREFLCFTWEALRAVA